MTELTIEKTTKKAIQREKRLRTNQSNPQVERLLWTWFQKKVHGSVAPAELAKRFPMLDMSTAYKDLNHHLKRVEPMLDTVVPGLVSLIGQVFQGNWLKNTPLTTLAKGNQSILTIKITVCHDTGKVQWLGFDQKIFHHELDEKGQTVAIPLATIRHASGSVIDPALKIVT